MPPSDCTPPLLADLVTAAHKEVTKGRGAPKVKLEVFDHEQLAEMGCGGILSVGDSSESPSRLAELTWAPKGAVAHLALVGKGVTFDSGGLTIKPSSSMVNMKGDMAGAASVVAATLAIARLGLPVKVTTYAPMAENMVSATSTRPGDVITMHNGTTVEIANTDAEGRMLLGDALSLAVEDEPDVVIDIATLTGHMQLALGDKVGAVMGTDDQVPAILAAGVAAGEQHWRMPIPEEMSERITSSKVADLLQHDWVRWGGGLYASAFLREFTGGLPWAHLDIAGKEMNLGGPYGHVPSGATGFGVTTLVEFARCARRGLDPLRLLARVVVAHPLRHADHGGVVRRHAVAVGEVVRPLDARHPPPGPLPVVRDEQQGHVADRRARLDESLDPLRWSTNFSRCRTSSPSEARTVVEPVRAASRAGRLVRPLRRNRSNMPMADILPGGASPRPPNAPAGSTATRCGQAREKCKDGRADVSWRHHRSSVWRKVCGGR